MADHTTMIRIRPRTRETIDRIAAQKFWSNVTVVDQAVVALAKQEGIPLPEAEPGQGRRKPKRPAA